MSNLHLHVFHARPKSYYINWGTYIAIRLHLNHIISNCGTYIAIRLYLNHIISNFGTYIAISLNFALSIFTLRSADTRKGLSLDFDLDRDLDFDLDFLR